MALDPGGDDLDSAGDPVVACRAVLSRRDPEHHDARRPCAGGRHIGRRFDRHHREHPPSVDRGAHAAFRATLHGAAEIAVPTLVSTLAISCVFTSVVFLDGPAKYLFTPLGLAVVFAMLASYGLSRTLTPITIGLLLKSERHGTDDGPRLASSRGSPRIRPRLRASARWLYENPHTLLRRRAIVPVVAVLMLPLAQ
jgi:multidrug efflux pump subunit AcrB